MIRVRAKIEKNTLFGRGLVKIREKIVKRVRVRVTLCGKALARVRAKLEKNLPFW